ncbi:hypothetical protein B0H14DRAFT_2383697, partial [Mycena olivaceomarginata]
GPGIPRRDKSDVYPRYCQLMLIFFKPWRHAKDLRKEGQSWEDAFQSFALNCSASIRCKMDNMQILHECRDSRDNHFAERWYIPCQTTCQRNQATSQQAISECVDYAEDAGL